MNRRFSLERLMNLLRGERQAPRRSVVLHEEIHAAHGYAAKKPADEAQIPKVNALGSKGVDDVVHQARNAAGLH